MICSRDVHGYLDPLLQVVHSFPNNTQDLADQILRYVAFIIFYNIYGIPRDIPGNASTNTSDLYVDSIKAVVTIFDAIYGILKL